MKKILAILIAVLMVWGSVFVVGASELDVTQSADIMYEVPGSFYINIPMQINVGEQVVVTAGSLNIPDYKCVKVSFANLNGNNGIALTNGVNDDYLTVRFQRLNGEPFTQSDNIIGTFRTDNPGMEYRFESTVEYVPGTVSAGMYNGTVDFYIEYTDAG